MAGSASRASVQATRPKGHQNDEVKNRKRILTTEITEDTEEENALRAAKLKLCVLCDLCVEKTTREKNIKTMEISLPARSVRLSSHRLTVSVVNLFFRILALGTCADRAAG